MQQVRPKCEKCYLQKFNNHPSLRGDKPWAVTAWQILRRLCTCNKAAIFSQNCTFVSVLKDCIDQKDEMGLLTKLHLEMDKWYAEERRNRFPDPKLPLAPDKMSWSLASKVYNIRAIPSHEPFHFTVPPLTLAEAHNMVLGKTVLLKLCWSHTSAK